eukprot:TRINITY_DN16493_c0_g1_i1.p1 TRINITY_DN16493_c0_g1~~TRINITY_DN16493_c0_g1_i1.p1  ORF type:complete len:496 (+),score=170.58 TRINITY_DN16493_c0_g1_i1:56-1489(+)
MPAEGVRNLRTPEPWQSPEIRAVRTFSISTMQHSRVSPVETADGLVATMRTADSGLFRSLRSYESLSPTVQAYLRSREALVSPEHAASGSFGPHRMLLLHRSFDSTELGRVGQLQTASFTSGTVDDYLAAAAARDASSGRRSPPRAAGSSGSRHAVLRTARVQLSAAEAAADAPLPSATSSRRLSAEASPRPAAGPDAALAAAPEVAAGAAVPAPPPASAEVAGQRPAENPAPPQPASPPVQQQPLPASLEQQPVPASLEQQPVPAPPQPPEQADCGGASALEQQQPQPASSPEQEPVPAPPQPDAQQPPAAPPQPEVQQPPAAPPQPEVQQPPAAPPQPEVQQRTEPEQPAPAPQPTEPAASAGPAPAAAAAVVRSTAAAPAALRRRQLPPCAYKQQLLREIQDTRARCARLAAADGAADPRPAILGRGAAAALTRDRAAALMLTDTRRAADGVGPAHMPAPWSMHRDVSPMRVRS